MKKQDFLFIFVLVIIFLPFFVSEPVYDWYKSFNAAHGMVMSFIKLEFLLHWVRCWDFVSVPESITEKDLAYCRVP